MFFNPLFGTKKLRKKCRAMVHSENLGLRKTHTPKLVASLLKQLVYVPAAPFYLASKFFLHYPNARNLQTSIISPHLIIQFVFLGFLRHIALPGGVFKFYPNSFLRQIFFYFFYFYLVLIGESVRKPDNSLYSSII